MRRYALMILRLCFVVAGTSVIAVFGLVIARQWLSPEVLRASNGEVGNYLQALGTIYAVLLAFVVFSVWNQFNEARVNVDREANEVVDLFRTSDGFPDEQRAHMQAELHRYVDAVIDEEWPAMVAGDEGTIERIGAQLDVIWNSLHGFEPASECHKALHAEALTLFNELSNARTARLSSARMRIPPGLRLFLYAGALIMVGSMYLLAVDSFAIHAVISGALAGAVSHILYLVSDLDDPFSGEWRVWPTPFERVQRYMARRSR